MKKHASHTLFGSSVIFAVLLTFFVAPAPVWAAEPNWHYESASYYIYLGVVPASLIKKNPVLVDGDKTLHRDDSAGDSSEHVMVAVFRKPNNERVVNATVIARVGIKKLLGGAKLEKPLEKMLTSGAVTYGNYFPMPKQGEYEIAVRIYEPNKDQAETATFIYKKF
jgi:hypothetical protein